MPATFVENGPTSDCRRIKRVVSIWTASGGPPRHALPLPRGKGTGAAESPYSFEKTLEPRIASKQFAGCLHEQVGLVPRQHIGCRDRFQLRPKALVLHLVEAQVENMKFNIPANYFGITVLFRENL